MDATEFKMPSTARLSALTLRVRRLDRMLEFYRDLLGLRILRTDGDTVLGPEEKAFTLRLVEAREAPLRPRGSIGLYHFALLLPDRRSLAAVLRRLIEGGWPIGGASDHGVSEALYLADPEGNGIELYRDRPRPEWPTAWDQAADQVAMVTEALDVPGLLSEAQRPEPLHAETRLGHVHLHISELAAAEAFYVGGLGLNVRQRSYPGALFLAAGDYHHHVGLNTWARRPAPADATGLLHYEWLVPEGIVDSLEGHLAALAVAHHKEQERLEAVDPSGVKVGVREGTAAAAEIRA